MRASDVMSSRPASIGASATLQEAAKLLVNAGVSALPVLDERGAMVGIVSELDLIRHAMGGAEDLALLKSSLDDPATGDVLSGGVADVMTRQVITTTEDAELAEVAALMLRHGAKRIPVLRGSSVVGIVSRIDLIKVMLSRTAPDATKAAPEAGRDDEALRQEVIAAVQRLGIPLGGTFDVVVRHGVVHLWGRVSSPEQDQACRMAASKVPSIVDVISHMQVIPRH